MINNGFGRGRATTLLLNRLIQFFKTRKLEYNKTYIARVVGCGDTVTIKDGLNFLIRHGFITCRKNEGMTTIYGRKK